MKNMKIPCKFTTPPRDPLVGPLTGHLLKARNRFAFYKWMATFGEYTRFKLASMDVYLFTNPEAVNHILKKNARNYTKNTPSYKVVERVTGKGIFTESEESWLRLRKIAQPFFTHKQTDHWEAIVERISDDLKIKLDEISTRDEIYPFSPLMTQLTLRVLGESIFDKDLGKSAEIFNKELGQLIKLTNDKITYQMSLNFIKKNQSEKKFRSSMAILDNLISNLIDEAKLEKEYNPNNMIHAFLKAPFEVDQSFLIDQVKTMAFAGHETTSTVLSWALHFLSIYPEWQLKIRDELKTQLKSEKIKSRELEQCPLLNAFINETIRMYPPAWAFSRRALEDDIVEGHPIKAGSIVTVSPYLMAHDEKYWIDPEEFNPLRFIDPVHLEKQHSYSFIPFGMGPRACVGEKLSRLELSAIIATFIKDFELLVPENCPVEMEATLTLAVKDGIKLKIRKHSFFN